MLDAALLQETHRASVVETRPGRVQHAAPGWARPVTPQCVVQEAARQSIELVKVLAVMKAEGGRVGEYSPNTNGSYDIGPMQVNTIHLPELSKIYRLPESELSKVLAFDGCFNVAVGAWLLRKRTNEAGGDFWYGVGRYHSATRPNRNRYILRVHKIMVRMVNAKKIGPARRGEAAAQGRTTLADASRASPTR